MHVPKPIALSIRARSLRAASTDAERRIWRSLRSRQVMGCKFRRQHPVGPYIVDFVFLERRLVIELDGSQHQQAIEHDATRDALLRRRGFVVLRFWDNDVLNETQAVLEKIRTVALLRPPSPPPSPTGVGEGDCAPAKT
jgi:very-short-patch-repair endonuclease